MAILAAPTTELNVVLPGRSNKFAAFGPTLRFAYHFQQAIGSVSFFIILRTVFTVNLVLLGLLVTAKVVAFRSYLVSKFLAVKTATLLRLACVAASSSKSVRRFRKKMEYEVYALFVGPGVNTMLLLVFWPGWLVVAPMVLGLSMCIG
jgi:hypothetical protein